MHLLTTTPATAPALAVADARAHLRTASSDDAYLETLIAVATAWVEAWTGRALINRTYTYKLDRFPCASWCLPQGRPWGNDQPIELPYPPLVSVTSVTYRDTESSTLTLSGSTDYELDLGSSPGQIIPRYGKHWPLALDHPLSVTVVYVAGYGASDALVPPQIRHALMLLVGHLYENREASSPIAVNTVPYGIEHLLMPWRVFTRF
jgi:uncharacterized phiE125 gp8 family phage protein